LLQERERDTSLVTTGQMPWAAWADVLIGLGEKREGWCFLCVEWPHTRNVFERAMVWSSMLLTASSVVMEKRKRRSLNI